MEEENLKFSTIMSRSASRKCTGINIFGNILDSNMSFSPNFDASYKKTSGRSRLLERMRCYLTTQAARLVYVMMIIPIITAGCALKSPYNATQSAKRPSSEKDCWGKWHSTAWKFSKSRMLPACQDLFDSRDESQV